MRGQPELTPRLAASRAVFWGSVLAVWAVGGLTLKAAKALHIDSVADIKGKVGNAMEPVAARLSAVMDPYRESVRLPPAAGCWARTYASETAAHRAGLPEERGADAAAEALAAVSTACIY